MKAYKGYSASLEYDSADQEFFGTVIGIKDVVHFTGASVKELEQAFHDSVDAYLDFMQERGKKPARPYSGKLALRTSPEHHRLISEAASHERRSVNQWIDETLAKAAKETLAEGVTKVGIR
jgi:predicted HicB family RNase H-like nuclease